MVKDCNKVALSILWFCIEHKIDITVEWIPREENQLADALSKDIIPKDIFTCDYKLNPEVFQQLASLFGEFHTDLFASDTNKQLDRFFSYHYSPNAAAVDAFYTSLGPGGLVQSPVCRDWPCSGARAVAKVACA